LGGVREESLGGDNVGEGKRMGDKKKGKKKPGKGRK